MSRTKKVQTSDSIYNDVMETGDKFVSQKGQDVVVEEFIKGIALHKEGITIMITSPIDASLVISTLTKYMKKNYPHMK